MTGLVIEGDDLRVDPSLVDSARMRLKPGYYVREGGDLLSVHDPIYPHRVRKALGLGEVTRNLIAVHSDGEPHVLESAAREIEHGPEPWRWQATMILPANARRLDTIEIALPGLR